MAELRPLAGPDVDLLLKLAAEARIARRYDEAESLYRLAAELAPGAAVALHNLGGVYKVLGRLAEAEVASRRALALAPDMPVIRHALGVVLLSQGRFAEGFSLYEARHEVPALGNPKPDLPFPEWRGEPLAGKRLAVLPEQGYGDQIQFSRFVPDLQAQGAEVILVAKPALRGLFARSFTAQVVGAQDDLAALKPDYWVMSASLAGRLGVTLQTVPASTYLKANASGAQGAGLRIGVTTRGEPGHPNDANRSLDAEAAARLSRLPAEIVSLHPEDSGAADFAETADLIAGLDLVVTVDTAVAHLAGALGKPCWMLTPAANTDWRWLSVREDTPWYPTLSLYRQTVIGDWNGPIDRVEADLAALRA